MIVDLVALISLWAVLYTVQLQISSREGVALNNFIKNVGIQSIIAALMLFSAYHITNFVKTKTNQKPNSCLLYWHIVNLSVQQIFSVATFVMEQKQLELKQNESEDPCQQIQLAKATVLTRSLELIEQAMSIYVDLFLLYILYRFTRPQKVSTSTEETESTLSSSIFAHDYRIAT